MRRHRGRRCRQPKETYQPRCNQTHIMRATEDETSLFLAPESIEILPATSNATALHLDKSQWRSQNFIPEYSRLVGSCVRMKYICSFVKIVGYSWEYRGIMVALSMTSRTRTSSSATARAMTGSSKVAPSST
jgi:hypothetical protein